MESQPNNQIRKAVSSINNEVSSTSSEDMPHSFGKVTKYYNSKYKENVSDNESQTKTKPLQSRSHYKSTGNLTETDNSNFNTRVQNSISNIDLSLHSHELSKLQALKVPIVGYEVMEERARFTIYKLKVQADKSNQCWLVFRRYTDFVRLYSKIKSDNPTIILPLPGKRWFRDNFEPAFLDERVRGLQKFVNAILNKLPNNPLVRDFFCLDEPPQVFSYQPEVQAVYGALEDSISTLKIQLKQRDAAIVHLQNKITYLEAKARNCKSCKTQMQS